ncbi:glycosyltransferase family 4 protein [Pseudoalteromonas sp. SR45-4]|uniref:glycosyltransferase family 4 protein n=1 Tax=Pseudoalteromonas sp. SR45-4 TaxID=2760929 RepID=UPI0015F7994B|nr:glycosyltransferase family 4 protein [Pseudoalteromonas sp. SR45-4]MBB1369932.1 glycosyltransferase family 4 protein [Pseudoalteromonas sp. SR45-4]
MKNNIWYISKYANIKEYGADTRQASFCEEFAKTGHKVRLITSNSSHLYGNLPNFKSRYFDMKSNNFDVTWVNTLKYSKATSIKRIVSWLWFDFFVFMMAFNKKYEKPDVVIASSLSLFTVLTGCFYKKFYKAKFIFEVRDIWPQTLIDLKGFSSKHPLIWFLNKIEKLGYKYSDAIVGTMPGLKLHVENEVGLGSKVRCIPQGVSLAFYDNSQEKLSEEYVEQYIPKNKFIVTYTGTFGEANALEYIIDSAKKLRHLSCIHFLLVGDGYLKDHLIESAKELTNITFAPKVVKEQVQHLLSLSDLLVASVRDEKIYKYGISLNKFIDYMYAKKPIVCMYSGYPSMINEAKCGEFTPAENSNNFASTIEKYQLMTPLDRKLIGGLGYNFLINERSFDVLSRKYMELFNEASL